MFLSLSLVAESKDFDQLLTLNRNVVLFSELWLYLNNNILTRCLYRHETMLVFLMWLQVRHDAVGCSPHSSLYQPSDAAINHGDSLTRIIFTPTQSVLGNIQLVHHVSPFVYYLTICLSYLSMNTDVMYVLYQNHCNTGKCLAV